MTKVVRKTTLLIFLLALVCVGSCATDQNRCNASLSVHAVDAGNVTVFVDGRRVGTSPVVLECIEVGVRRIHVESESLGVRSTTVDVVPGMTYRWLLTASTWSISEISSTPMADLRETEEMVKKLLMGKGKEQPTLR